MRRPASAFVVGMVAVLVVRSSDAQPDLARDYESLARVAALFPKDPKTARKTASAIAAKLESMEYMMTAFKPRKRHGLGVGPKPGKITPDGIELYLHSVKGGIHPAALKEQAAALEEMGRRIAAVGEIALHFDDPSFGKGNKNKKDWQARAQGLRDAGLRIAEAAARNSRDDFNAGVLAALQQCAACHVVFRD
ncbi:MAG: hypothetical protein U0793_11950 [Gemmataceae bacterium]